MTIVKFKLDKEKDLENIWKACQSNKLSFGHDFKKSISKEIIKKCEGRKFENVENWLKNRRKLIHENPLVKDIERELNLFWSKRESEYIKRLEKITKREFKFKKIYAYFTTISKCPYNPANKIPYFYVNLFTSTPNALHTVGHEVMHLHLHKSDWLDKVKNQIGQQKAYDLIEAFTKLLDLEFRDLWIVEERGYPNHQKLREYIKKHWLKNKNFDKLTNDCIRWIKRNGVK